MSKISDTLSLSLQNNGPLAKAVFTTVMSNVVLEQR